MSFTGILERDFDILLNLDPLSLMYVCRVNTYVNDICRDDYFWRQKVDRDYGEEVVRLKPSEETFQQQWNRLHRLDPMNSQVAARGYLDELTVLEKSGNLPDQDDVYYAVKGGHIHVLDWLAQRGFVPDEEAVNEAVINGNIDILNWLEQRDYQFDWRTANLAAWYCQIAVLNWLEKRRILPTTEGANAANESCSSNILDWLAERDIFPDED